MLVAVDEHAVSTDRDFGRDVTAGSATQDVDAGSRIGRRGDVHEIHVDASVLAMRGEISADLEARSELTTKAVTGVVATRDERSAASADFENGMTVE